MNQYYDIFSVSRIPKPQSDILVNSANSRHIVIMVHGSFHRINVLDAHGQILPKASIFQSILELISQQNVVHDTSDISILTSLHRDDWTTVNQCQKKSTY